jgi:hypothetical protein
MSTAAGTATCLFGEATASLFFVLRAEVTIDRPVRDVWEVITDLSLPILKSWNPEIVSVQHLSGEPRQENEFVLVTKDTGAVATRMRTLKIVPNQQRVLRVDAVDGSLIAVVDHSLYEVEKRKTRVIYNGYIESCGMPADQIKTFDYKKTAQSSIDYLNRNHELLKKAVEERTPAT